jgi:hypothetical protein
LDKWIVSLRNGRVFSPADSEKKLIGIRVKLVELIAFDMEKAERLEMFKDSGGGKNEVAIRRRHH